MLELLVCTVSVCLCPGSAEQQGCGLAQSRVVINLSEEVHVGSEAGHSSPHLAC